MDGRLFPEQKAEINFVIFDSASHFLIVKKCTDSESIDSEPVPLLRPQAATNRLCGLYWARSGTCCPTCSFSQHGANLGALGFKTKKRHKKTIMLEKSVAVDMNYYAFLYLYL